MVELVEGSTQQYSIRNRELSTEIRVPQTLRHSAPQVWTTRNRYTNSLR